MKCCKCDGQGIVHIKHHPKVLCDRCNGSGVIYTSRNEIDTAFIDKLRGYTSHHIYCNLKDPTSYDDDRVCTCGLNKLIDVLTRTKEG